MLETRFVNLHPIMQQMFLDLHNVKNAEKKDFVMETLLKEFGDVAIEAIKVFDRFNMLGSCVDGINALGKLGKTEPIKGEEIKDPIPVKLVAMHEALEETLDRKSVV